MSHRGRYSTVAMAGVVVLALVWVLAAVSSSSAARPRAHAAAFKLTFSKPANQALTDTGIALTTNQEITITAKGSPNYCGTGSCKHGAAGEKLPGNCLLAQYLGAAEGKDFTAPGLPCFGLIARIGTGPVFALSAKYVFFSPISGELYLGTNDNNYADNTGSYTVTVTGTP